MSFLSSRREKTQDAIPAKYEYSPLNSSLESTLSAALGGQFFRDNPLSQAMQAIRNDELRPGTPEWRQFLGHIRACSQADLEFLIGVIAEDRPGAKGKRLTVLERAEAELLPYASKETILRIHTESIERLAGRRSVSGAANLLALAKTFGDAVSYDENGTPILGQNSLSLIQTASIARAVLKQAAGPIDIGSVPDLGKLLVHLSLVLETFGEAGEVERTKLSQEAWHQLTQPYGYYYLPDKSDGMFYGLDDDNGSTSIRDRSGKFSEPQPKRRIGELEEIGLIEKIDDDARAYFFQERSHSAYRWKPQGADGSPGYQTWLGSREERIARASLYFIALGAFGAEDEQIKNRYTELFGKYFTHSHSALTGAAVQACGLMVAREAPSVQLQRYLEMLEVIPDFKATGPWSKVKKRLSLMALSYPADPPSERTERNEWASKYRLLLTHSDPKVRKASFSRLERTLMDRPETTWPALLNEVGLDKNAFGSVDDDRYNKRPYFPQSACPRVASFFERLLSASKLPETRAYLVNRIAWLLLNPINSAERKGLGFPSLVETADRMVAHAATVGSRAYVSIISRFTSAIRFDPKQVDSEYIRSKTALVDRAFDLVIAEADKCKPTLPYLVDIYSLHPNPSDLVRRAQMADRQGMSETTCRALDLLLAGRRGAQLLPLVRKHNFDATMEFYRRPDRQLGAEEFNLLAVPVPNNISELIAQVTTADIDLIVEHGLALSDGLCAFDYKQNDWSVSHFQAGDAGNIADTLKLVIGFSKENFLDHLNARRAADSDRIQKIRERRGEEIKEIRSRGEFLKVLESMYESVAS